MHPDRTSGASSASAPRPSPRLGYPDLSRRSPGQAPGWIVHDPLTGRRFRVRTLTGRIGDQARARFEIQAEGERSHRIADFGDYHDCQCREFRRDWECAHSRALLNAGLIVEERFCLTADKAGGNRV